MKYSQYIVGEPFKNFDELLKWVLAGRSVNFAGYTRNSVWVKNQQLGFLLRCLHQFRKVYPKKLLELSWKFRENPF